MFVKKGLLFATALALMMFTGQASAQGGSASLTVDGDVRGIGANQEITVNVSVSGVTGQTNGASITLLGAGDNATITGVSPASGFLAPGGAGNPVNLIGLPPQDLTDGFSFGSITLTTGAGVTEDTEFNIQVAVSVNIQGGDPVLVNSNQVTINEAPSAAAVADMMSTVVPRGGSATVKVSTIGFPDGADIQFRVTAGPGVTSLDEGATLTLTSTVPGVVTVVASDGTTTSPPLVITFQAAPPELMASATDVIIPTGMAANVTITAVGFDADDVVSYSVDKVSGTATITTVIVDNKTVQLAASGTGNATVTVSASGTDPVTIRFWAMPTISASAAAVVVPTSTVPTGTATVTATGFPPTATVTFAVDPPDAVEASQAGNVLTLTATGTATVSVTASDGTTTTDPVTVTFTQDLPAAPGSLTVQDLSEDNGFFVLATFSNSADHASLSQYRIYREMAVNDADGNPTKAMVPWAPVDAVPSDDDMTRAVIPVPDGMPTRWGVAAERGQASSEPTLAGKRVFSKESVQLLVQALGVDPNLIISQDELAQMFMPSADYIQSIIGDRKNVVFAALDPDVSVLMGGDVAVPQNIRTDGHVGGIVTSSITMTENAVAAVDNIAPAAVTDLTGDAETGMVTWTLSADEGIVGAIDYRGHAIPIPGVVGYEIKGGVSEDALISIGFVEAGTSTFQVPLELIQALIDQGAPAAILSVVAHDGTHATPTAITILLAPVRKAFVDADGGPVYIVKLEDAMTPLTVDFEDFVAFSLAFNTSEANSTREEWRVFIQADLNDDGVVNFDDFILFFSSYGKEATGRATKSLVPALGINENAEFSLRLGSDRVVVGETMFVDVSLANVQALTGYGFVLNYDAEKFEFVEAMPVAEDLLTSSGGEIPLLKGWSPEAGQVHVMNAIVNGSEVSGGGDIVRLVFRVLRDFEDNARFEIANGLVFDPQQLANPLAGGVLDIQTTPTEFALLQNFPNPFNPETTIGYELSESADVTLQIYNVVGQVIRTLIASEPQSVGRYQVRWDGMDDRGVPVSSGIYFYQISAGKFQDVRKLMLLK